MAVGRLADELDFDGWRAAARRFVAAGLPPEQVGWTVGDAAGDLFAALGEDAAPTGDRPVTAPRALVETCEQAFAHRDPARFDLFYRLLWRAQTTRGLMARAADRDVSRLRDLAKAIRRDVHKMHAFVRFRETEDAAGPLYLAWFEPEHRIIRAGTPFFARRFANMRWSILTPDGAAHWDLETLTFGPGATAEEAACGDALEDLWRAYFASIFNPARLKVKAMQAEMPKKYWRNLPEARLIKPLIESARAREAGMVAAAPTPIRAEAAYTAPTPATAPGDLGALAAQIGACARCPHAACATQAVPGEGPRDARLMIVGEQPGDREDLAGRSFVGPAGQVFDEALEKAGVRRDRLWLTNAVKHFKFTPRGKRRLHQRPNVAEIDHCRWWLAAERRLIRPAATLAMGATALRALTGAAQGVEAARARADLTAFDGGPLRASLHPSAILRAPAERRQPMFESLTADLAAAWRAAQDQPAELRSVRDGAAAPQGLVLDGP